MVGDDDAFKAKAVQYINDVITPSFAASTFAGPVVAAGTPTPFIFDVAKLDAAKAAFAGVVVGTAPNEKDFDGFLSTTTPFNEMLAPNLILLCIGKLKQDVEGSYNKLVTILKVGMSKIMVTGGEVTTALTWHVDATDTDEIASSDVSQSFDQRATNWGVSRAASRSSTLSGQLFGMTFGRARGTIFNAGGSASRTRTELKVQLVNEKKTAVTHLNIDITGSVTVRFKSETFPPFDPAVAA